MILKRYVEFYVPGLLAGDSFVKEVKSRDIKKLKVPNYAYGFIFFDIAITEEKGIVMKSDRLEISPMYFYGGRVMTLAEVRREMPNEKTLIMNMRSCGLKRIIICRTGNCLPFGKNDVLIGI